MSNNFDEVAKKLSTLDDFIDYCKNTKESEWQVDIVRDRGNTKNCLYGHLVNWYYGKEYEGSISPVWDFFEEAWSSTFFVYDVNDGRNPRYPQKTAKTRCVALLEALNSGEELTTNEAIERDMALIKEKERA